ncbi:histidinol-phosphate aminotransferase [Desulfofundulus australicus DSM 11792]|uniref:Histidinol-phosphate aminotransferase n=1 Tax=Desulfofundulus australicus DSM 11792 TaxID=1121425 RepID=A0A1M5ARE7_9FIRM|nr:histidinol-phosphate transaminase [Desulfofundulus australicus]SHF32819.1 histidinol-phosphate aminotransferase [Desulfofundulus australicus DSM 11792]
MNDAFNPALLVRPDLEGLVPYEVHIHHNVIKLDANENPYDFPPAVREEIGRELVNLTVTRYPDPLAGELVARLSAYTGVPAEGILAGNGSDELILTLLLTFGTGGRVIITPPTFSMYGVHARIAGARPVDVPRRENFALDVPAIIAAAGHPETRVIFLCSPNNPTGNATPLEEVAEILKNTRALVVVDEAYQEFGGKSSIPLLREYPNLVVLRTFSKAFGLAGLRVGYLLADPAVIKQLLRTKQPFNLNSFSQLAACKVMEHREEFNRLIGQIRQDREELYREMAALPGVEVYPSAANFILFRTRRPAEQVYQELLANGILIRNVHGPGVEQCLRVTVGKKDENRLFLEKLKMILGLQEVGENKFAAESGRS